MRVVAWVGVEMERGGEMPQPPTRGARASFLSPPAAISTATSAADSEPAASKENPSSQEGRGREKVRGFGAWRVRHQEEGTSD